MLNSFLFHFILVIIWKVSNDDDFKMFYFKDNWVPQQI